MTRPKRPVGELLRDWRRSRRLSQLDLSIETGISARHLSFVETGRSRPSPEMILRLAEQLDIPLAERNTILLAGGHAPAYPRHELDDPELAPVRAAVRQILDGHSPYPAALVDQHWHLVEANPAIALFTAGAAPHLLAPPVNVLRLGLHPDGMAPRILNLPEWRAHLLVRLRQQAMATNDDALHGLIEELRGYPGGHAAPAGDAVPSVVVPLRYRHDNTDLSFFSTTTLFGTPLDVTVAGLAIEAFFPADPATAEALRALVG
ncbi:transcriptional regulator [Asanoa ishikariensis]|uniref:Transcriptional regulator, contains XRE-family HTH domain n=1 Tax=Asanoa ishikariensis TaxID=137265 RepID=A0A1H3PG75_9ACTN|nr:helix-turn-helix transcriptional regulator [Asanoa ishikariensis]GIF67826.1 transcriptional regulator [Asanoa ishikariensis]SDZ00134.1 Transcriptional regulator, contains XRE-family HTH domain [Asanoa ishikariensis]